MVSSKAFVFKKIPTELPVAGEHLTVEDRPVDIDSAPQGGVVLEVLYLSFDPYLRGRMRDPSIKSYMPAFEVGTTIPNRVIATVLKSDSPEFSEGDTVFAFVPLAEYIRVADVKAAGLRKINNPHGFELGYFLGPLGMPGLTAWAGLHKIGKPKEGETLFVSSAAGAVGQIVGQIAKRRGLKVVGSVGSDEKLEYITKELGFDGGFNYKKESPFDALPRLAPDGIDINFENVGSDHLDAALQNMNANGRVVLCGMIDNYNVPFERQQGIRNLVMLIAKHIVIEGFLQGQPDFGPKYWDEHQKVMQEWLADGSVKATIHTVEGMDNAPAGFIGMLEGKNFGKAVLKVK